MKLPRLEVSSRALQNRILDDVDSAIRAGYARAHKYTETPDEFTIKEQIASYVQEVLFDWFEWEPCICEKCAAQLDAAEDGEGAN